MIYFHADRIDPGSGSPAGSHVRGWLVVFAFVGLCTASAAPAAFGETLTLAWDASATADVTGYLLSYGTASGTYTSTIDVGNRTTYTVGDLTAGTRYYFAVRAVSPGATTGYSNEVSSIPFTDSTLTTGLTVIRAAHINELRSRINTLRTANGLAAESWTDSALSSTTPVRAVHITELRSALAAVYTKLNKPGPTYTDPTITVGVTVAKAAHIQELRRAVVAIE